VIRPYFVCYTVRFSGPSHDYTVHSVVHSEVLAIDAPISTLGLRTLENELELALARRGCPGVPEGAYIHSVLVTNLVPL